MLLLLKYLNLFLCSFFTEVEIHILESVFDVWIYFFPALFLFHFYTNKIAYVSSTQSSASGTNEDLIYVHSEA